MGDLTGNLPVGVYLLIPLVLAFALLTSLALGSLAEPRVVRPPGRWRDPRARAATPARPRARLRESPCRSGSASSPSCSSSCCSPPRAGRRAASPGSEVAAGSATAPRRDDAGGGGGASPAATHATGPNDTSGITDDEIVIGIHAPVTGASPIPQTTSTPARTSTGSSSPRAIPKALGGRKVRVVFRDDEFNPSRAVQVCREMVEKEKAFVLVGGGGADQITACAKYANQIGVPYFSAGVNEDGLDRPLHLLRGLADVRGSRSRSSSTSSRSSA